MHSKREFFVTMSRRRLILFAALAIRTLPLGQLLLVGCLQQLLWASPSAGWIPSPPIIRGGSGGGVGKSAISTSLCKQRPPRGWFTDSNVRPNRNYNKRWTAATANTERRGSNSGNGEAEAVPEHLNNKRPRYDLGIGKNKPKQEEYHAADIAAAAAAAAVNCEDDETILGTNGSTSSTAQNWMVPESVVKPESFIPVKTYRMSRVVKGNNTNGSTDAAAELVEPPQPVKTRRMVA